MEAIRETKLGGQRFDGVVLYVLKPGIVVFWDGACSMGSRGLKGDGSALLRILFCLVGFGQGARGSLLSEGKHGPNFRLRGFVRRKGARLTRGGCLTGREGWLLWGRTALQSC